jgi:hypothetical protein
MAEKKPESTSENYASSEKKSWLRKKERKRVRYDTPRHSTGPQQAATSTPV